MQVVVKTVVIVVMLGLLGSAGCVAAPPSTSVPTGAGPWTIYAPESTSSIPVMLAAQQLPNVKLVLYNDQTQANAIFLRGEAPLMVTGLAVGKQLYQNEAPVQIANSYVTGLSSLVTSGQVITRFADLKDGELVVPFEGSPIEEISAYFAAQDGLTWGTDIHPVYSPFDASVAQLKQGQAKAVILPEPVVAQVEGQPDLFVSVSLYDLWNQQHPGADGYPQVVTLVNPAWAKTHSAEVAQFNQALRAAIAQVQQDPAGAVEAVKSSFKLPAEKLVKSLQRTHYRLTSGSEMQQSIENYYRVIGKPLDEKFAGLYYLPAQ